MTVKKLIETLGEMPQELEVLMYKESDDENHIFLEVSSVQELDFKNILLGVEKCVCISPAPIIKIKHHP